MSQKNANKPVILEEFGILTNQLETYTAWYSTVISSGLAGDLIWYVSTWLFPSCNTIKYDTWPQASWFSSTKRIYPERWLRG